MLTERNMRRMDNNRSVVKLLVGCKPKAQRIGTREHYAHTLHSKHVREERGVINKVGQQGNLVYKNVGIAGLLQTKEVAPELSEVVER